MAREAYPPKQTYVSAKTMARSVVMERVSTAVGNLVKKVTERGDVDVKHLDEDAHPINSVINRRVERGTNKASNTTAVKK
ncbi:uncharacterized protein EAE97_000744 [Botrytis byssoidea]|uniref:Uncharacterized protein n=1 Tax=Botrytis byssoidea TaxID=139641 RepID=A0A9P5M8Z5_9HELO|nr:uncharacterized protein EAE97_000744 [Botrytis byssoidea]KAF7955485.1 hypothetical protein EAE97_000744 [Botrytis byssoidea]